MLETLFANSRYKLSFHSKLPLREGPEGMQSLGGLQRLLVGGESLADSPGLLWAEVQGLVLLALVELPQVLLLLLVHHNVDASDGLPDHADLGQLGGGSSSHLGDTELSKLCLEVIELFSQLFLLAVTQLGALNLTHRESERSTMLPSGNYKQFLQLALFLIQPFASQRVQLFQQSVKLMFHF